MSQYYPKPYEPFGGDLNIKVDLFDYATKGDLKNGTGVNTSPFAKKTELGFLKFNLDKLDVDKLNNVPANLSYLKSKVDQSDINKVQHVPVDLSKLSNVVKNGVVKKDVYNAKIKNIEDK